MLRKAMLKVELFIKLHENGSFNVYQIDIRKLQDGQIQAGRRA